MKKLIIASTIAISLNVAFSPLAFAKNENTASGIAQPQKNEMIGFGSGAVAGAAVAGPLGAIIGGVFGLLIAEDINSDAELAASSAALSRANYDLQNTSENLAMMQQDYRTLQESQMLKLVSYETQTTDVWLNDFTDFESNLQFKTASYLVEDTYKNQLNSLASLVNNYPQLHLKLTGFADRRGDSDYNQALSKQRAEAVKTYLLSKNVSEAQISVSGAGEAPSSITHDVAKESNNNIEMMPIKLNTEDLFFERRVNITLINAQSTLTAAN